MFVCLNACFTSDHQAVQSFQGQTFHQVDYLWHTNRPMLRAAYVVILLHPSMIWWKALGSHGDRTVVIMIMGQSAFCKELRISDFDESDPESYLPSTGANVINIRSHVFSQKKLVRFMYRALFTSFIKRASFSEKMFKTLTLGVQFCWFLTIEFRLLIFVKLRLLTLTFFIN